MARFYVWPAALLVLCAVIALPLLPRQGVDAQRAVQSVRKLSAVTATDGDVEAYAASEADALAVYMADQTTDGVYELFSVPLAGGTPTRLSASGQTVVGFKVSPVGGQVVYAALQAGQANASLFSVPIGGGDVTPIVASLSTASAAIAFTADGDRVLFRATGEDPLDASTLYSAPAAGGPATLIADDVSYFALDPTSARVVFISASGTPNLRSAPVAGGSIRGLGTTSGASILITPDGTRVVYEQAANGNRPIVISLPLAGGPGTTLVPLSDALDEPTMQVSTDGAFLLYGGRVPTGYLENPRVFRLLRVPIAGGPAVTLHEFVAPVGVPTGISLAQAPGGGRIVYGLTIYNRIGLHTAHLASVPADGGQAVTLSSVPFMSGIVPFKLSADGTQVLFTLDYMLYRVPTAGGAAPTLLSRTRPVREFAFAADGTAVFFEVSNVIHILIEPGSLAYAPRDRHALSVEKPADGADVWDFTLVGQTALYRGIRHPDVIELYAANLAVNSVYMPLIGR
ncbi:MAG TPA: hypothetical protein PKD53_14650 [Chloroflexaceae bacterium]|nr:hypothetical protein [Chloroflexaceae bacterium]